MLESKLTGWKGELSVICIKVVV